MGPSLRDTGNTYLENAHTHMQTRTLQIQLWPTHGLLIPGCGFLKPGTMCSSPDCCFATQLHFWQRMCGSLFCPYHRQGSFPRPALTLEWSVTCRLSTRWPHHTPGSFTFGSCFPNELKRPIVQLRGRPQLPLPSICTSGPILQWLVSAGSAWFSFDHVLARSQLCQQGARWEENICHI